MWTKLLAQLTDLKNNENLHYKLLNTEFISRVTKGGKCMSIKTVVLFGNKLNITGLGIGKAETFALAYERARTYAHKNLFFIPITYNKSIYNVVKGTCNAAHVILYPAKNGTGIHASGPVYTLLNFLGIRNIYVKQIGSTNILNNVYAVLKALEQLL